MKYLLSFLLALVATFAPATSFATPFTETVPAPLNLPLPPQYPAAGGVVIVLTGANGNVYYQFSNPTGAFRGFNSTGNPARFRGNPFTVNDPIELNCGFTDCDDYFGGSIARMDVRFSAYDGDTQVGGFDENDISLLINGFNIGSWSGITTEITDVTGNNSSGFEDGFGNNTFNTAWFASTNPALLANILSTGQTVSQVLDVDPDDNYWDFRLGQTLSDPGIETIAPGYTLEKTVDGSLTYAEVGDVITYNYVVANIGSVNISNIQVEDDIIGTVTCSPTFLARTTSSTEPPNEALCTAQYTITQDDIEAGEVTNIANATGEPEFGELGPLTDQVTITGPPLVASMTLDKTTTATTFSTVGEAIDYTFTITNTGNVTLTDLVVTDPLIPSLSCSAATLLPEDAGNNVLTCTGTYNVTQIDIDNFINSGQPLVNTATLRADDFAGTPLTPVTDDETVNGPVASPTFTITKTPSPTTYAAAGETITYSFLITNTGNVTWPAPPTLTDALTDDEACPAGAVAPGRTVTCTATYTVDLDDMDTGAVPNTVDATITIGGVTETGQATAEVTAVIETGLLIEKTLASGPNPIASDTDELVYEYLLTNDGNSRLDTFVVTDNKVAVTCPAVTLDPGQQVTCTSAVYDVLQSDIDDGGVTNTASATALTAQDVSVLSDTVDLFIPADQSPELTMSKASDPDPVPPTAFVPGATVDYVYTITNTGNVTITDPVTVTDDRFPDPITCPVGPIAPGDFITCRESYTVTAQDVADGAVVNTATASDGTTTSNSDSVTIPQEGAAGITLEKLAVTTDFTAAGETIDYTFEVTNSGQTTIVDLTPITINDPLLGAPFTCPEQPAVLLPTQSYSCTRTYGPVTQEQIDAGEIVNTATAAFTAGGVTYTSPSSTATVTSSVVPLLSLSKSALAVDGGSQFDTLGEQIEYTFEVTNDGTQTLATVVVTDPLIPTLACEITDLAPGLSESCTGLYTVTQVDLDTQSIFNEAQALGTSPTGLTETADADTTIDIDPAAATYILDLEKTASTESFTTVGDVINYALEVSNIGNLTLTDVVVEDATLGLSCTIGRLAPTASDDSCVGSYEITQADIDRGFVLNEATASAANADDVSDDITATGPVRTPAFTVVKTADADTDVTVGTTVTYDHVVTNTGNVTLENITLTDSHASASGTVELVFTPSNVITALAPNASVTLQTSYVVTQDDIDAGNSITNTVSATATPPAGTTVDPVSTTEEVDLDDVDPQISVVKTESDGTGDFTNLPATETFTFEVFNEGNVTLRGFTLTDDLTGFSCVLPDIAVGGSVTTCADSSPLQTSYTLLQADIDRGSLTNEVTVSDGTTSADDTVTLAGPDQLPLLETVKTATGGADFDAVGDIVTYEYEVFNRGNITLTSAITVVDDKTTVTCPPTPAGGIAPGASHICSASYAVTQDDLDAGFVTNAATASISQPVVPSATHPTGTATVSAPEVTETVAASQEPAITIAKAVAPGTPSTYDSTSDVITFQFTVTNSGNVTLTDAVTVNDTAIGTSLTCPASGPVSIAPGDDVTCTTTWSPAQGDIDAGSFVNEATAATTFGGAAVETDPLTPATATATAIQTPQMQVVKTLAEIRDPLGNPSVEFVAGNTLVYNYEITNPGNTTLEGPIDITDNRIGTFECLAGDLAPGAAAQSCTATDVISTSDIELGSVTNVATGEDANGVVSDPASATVPGDANPAISMVKSVPAGTTFANVGDVIPYTYTVTNTSPGTTVNNVLVRPALVNPITITDDKIDGPISCEPTADGVLSPDEETTCTASYVVTQADLDAVQSDGAGGLISAFVTNNATAETTYGSGVNAIDVISPSDSVTVIGTPAPALDVAKAVTAGNSPAAVDDVLTYAITVTNSGNQRINGITVTDPLIPVLSCSVNGVAAAQPLTLQAGPNGAGDVAICSGTYTVTQADIDTQTDLANTAVIEGASPDGTQITAPGGGPLEASNTHPLVTDSGVLTVEKNLTAGTPAAAFTDVGQEVSYTITVTNDRLVTLENIRVTDSIVSGTCVIPGPLAPGASDSSCVFVYEVQQADIDTGSIDNIASAVATPVTPGAADITGDDDLTVFGPAFEPSISVNKTADVTEVTAATQTITYTYVIANNGNVTITDQPTLSDDKITDAADLTCAPIPAGGLLPTETITCTGLYEVTQEDMDAGFVTNIATVTVPDTYNGGVIEATDTETVDATRTPAMRVTKVADLDTQVAAGQTITYSYTVTNTGNVTLESIQLVDSHTTSAGAANLVIEDNGRIATLAPGDAVTLTATYVVTQADIDAGVDLTNVVTATATPPAGTVIDPVTATEVVTVEDAAPSLVALKTAQVLPDPIVPDVTVATFDITVENDGNVSLTAPVLTDTLRRADTTLITPAPEATYVSGDSASTGTVGVFDVGEVWTYTVSHRLTQADIDAGGLSNSVLAEATDPFGTEAEDTSDNGTGAGSEPTPLPITAAPAIEGVKTITSSTIAVDETVTYLITVENTGTVTLTDVEVQDDTLTRLDPPETPLALASGPTFISASLGSAEGTLQVGEVATYRATYVLTQEDVDAGGIRNTATVAGTDPNGTDVTDITNDAPGAGDTPTDLTIAASPAITMEKTLFSGGPTYNAVGQELVFNFEVENTGNITLTEEVTITDAMITDAGEAITCDPVPLAPGDTLNCQGSYFVTQDDLDTGEITNSATAKSDETDETEPSVEVVQALQEPELTLLKVADDMPPEAFFVGAIAGYTYTVTNTGNVTITDPITINDNKIDPADISCPVFPTDGIAPGGTYVCIATYEVTVDDNSLRVVTNNATATAGTTISPIVSETIPNNGIPALATQKALIAVNGDAGLTEFNAVGDILTYEFTVTNDGTVSFSNDVTVVDPLIAESPITCFTATTEDPDLRAGESVTCEGTYTVTQADLDAGFVFNEASSRTTFGVGPTEVESPVGTETTAAATDPELSVVKSVATLPVTAVGQVLTYTITTTNTGNQTLNSISVTDPLLPDLTCEIDELVPGAELVCSDTYTVTQADIDNTTGTLVNTADATALTPQGTEVTGTGVLTTAMPEPDPEFMLAKSAGPDPFGPVGSAVLYTFTATNTGTNTLFDITITDDIVDPAYSCTIVRLNVGANDNTCTLSYTVTQDDVDAGEILNVANATATDPFGTTVTATGTNTATGPDQQPALEAVKTASLGGTTPMSVITYTLTVENTGNVSLDPPQITDTMTRLSNSREVYLDAPFAYQAGDTDGDDHIDVDETWTYTAQYTLGLADLNAGGLSNTVDVTAAGPDGTTATDTSDDGNDGDGNTTDDPTVVTLEQGPAINTVKIITSGTPALGEVITYQITATNTGNITLTEPTITDTITRVDGGPAEGETTGPRLLSGNSDGIDPGEAWVWEFTYRITQNDVDAGGLVNTATAGGTGANGETVSDRSDNGNDGDGNIEDDETRFTILPVPALTVIKELVSVGDRVGQDAMFLITVTNTGEATLSDVTIVDTMTNFAGDVLAPVVVEVTSGDPASLPVNGVLTYTVTYELQQADIDAGGVTNTATASGIAPIGTTVSDVSDIPVGGDGSTPTDAPIIQNDSMVATKTASTPTRIAPDLFEVVFTLTLQNTGNVTQENLVLTDDLTAFVAPATLGTVGIPVVDGFTTGSVNSSYNGVSDTRLMGAGTSLAPDATGTIELTVLYDVSTGQPAGTNVFSATSDRITAQVTASTGVTVGDDPDILATKTVTPERATVGQTVTYTLTFTNNLATAESNLRLIDEMPVGLAYTPDSATYNGTDTPQPDIAGRTLTWAGVTIAPGETVTITLDARVIDGGLGDIVNRAYVLDPSGARVSNIAEATLRLPVEAVFDCTDIIGKVFDDRNMNGYQDGVIEDRGITDQTYQGGKFETAPVLESDGEPGLPNVRLSTVDGTIITTDEYGRFSVPCAALPGDIGENFTLKLDTRSLPSGYQLTTENPRVIRVTAGTMARMNFGATIATVVDIDLMDSAFAPGSAEITPALRQGVDQLIAVLREDPSVLRLTYYRRGEPMTLVRQRMDRLESLVRNRWRGTGSGRLPIERTINSLQ